MKTAFALLFAVSSVSADFSKVMKFTDVLTPGNQLLLKDTIGTLNDAYMKLDTSGVLQLKNAGEAKVYKFYDSGDKFLNVKSVKVNGVGQFEMKLFNGTALTLGNRVLNTLCDPSSWVIKQGTASPVLTTYNTKCKMPGHTFYSIKYPPPEMPIEMKAMAYSDTRGITGDGGSKFGVYTPCGTGFCR